LVRRGGQQPHKRVGDNIGSLLEDTNDEVTYSRDQKDVIVSVSEIDRMERETIYLKHDKEKIESLTADPVR
jgi:hypothetical protein